ncbi:MAG: hypothetical protein RR565_09895 [Erysipelothrix sp.]
MKQKFEAQLKQKQQQNLSTRQIQMLDFIMLNQSRLDQSILEAFESNPTFEVEDGYFQNSGLIFDDVLAAYIQGPSLKEDLYMQLLERKDLDHTVMSYLIESLNDKGLIPSSNLVLSEELNKSECEIERHRFALQHFDPIGIGSETVKDSITTQLSALKNPLADLGIKIIHDFLSVNDYSEAKIKETYKIDQETLDDVLNCIHKCSPTFNVETHSHRNSYPDMIINVTHQELECTSTRDYSKIKINYDYKLEDSDEIKAWYRESEALLEQIRYRSETITNVMQIILDKQKQFFMNQKPLRVLTQADVAEQLNINPSTVSRTIANKSVLFNGDIYELSDFFVSATKGGSSADTIKRKILRIVKNETKPYSDQKILELLHDEGIKVERRTVSKYRKELNIPSSSERRRIKKWY